MHQFLNGKLLAHNCEMVDVYNTHTYGTYFSCRIHTSKHLLFMVGVEKIPVFDRSNTSITRFEYQSYMRFLDIVNEKEKG